MGNICCSEDDGGGINMSKEVALKPGNPLEVEAEFEREGVEDVQIEMITWEREILVKGKEKTETIFGKDVKKPVCTVEVTGKKITLKYPKGKLTPKDTGKYTLMIELEGETVSRSIEVYIEDPKRAKKIKQMFNEIDKDKSGEITNEELAESLKKVNPDLADDDIQLMINESDVNGDGKVSLEEFDNFMRRAGL